LISKTYKRLVAILHNNLAASIFGPISETAALADSPVDLICHPE
jgi:hypothetical protein